MFSAVIIGAGLAGATRREGNHANSFHRHPEIRMLGIFDIDQKAARAAAEHYETTAFGSLADVFASQPDIVAIAVPHGHRADIWQALWDAGTVKCVICEKPLAATSAEAERIVATCHAAGIRLIVNYQRRFHPTFNALRDDIRSSRRGPVQNVQIYYTHGLKTNACHWVDLVVSLFGPPAWVSAEESPIPCPYAGDPNVTILFGYPEFHVQFVPLISFHDAFYTGEVCITFWHERLHLPSTTNYDPRHVKRWVAQDRLLEEAESDIDFRRLDDDFYAATESAVRCLTSTTEDAGPSFDDIAIVRLMEVIEQSTREHCRIDIVTP